MFDVHFLVTQGQKMGPEVYLPVFYTQVLSDVVPVKCDGLGG